VFSSLLCSRVYSFLDIVFGDIKDHHFSAYFSNLDPDEVPIFVFEHEKISDNENMKLKLCEEKDYHPSTICPNQFALDPKVDHNIDEAIRYPSYDNVVEHKFSKSSKFEIF
jgi:hypothetical protein